MVPKKHLLIELDPPIVLESQLHCLFKKSVMQYLDGRKGKLLAQMV